MPLYPNRFAQKVAILIFILTCTSLWYLRDTSNTFTQDVLPTTVAAYHIPKISRHYSIKPIAYIFPQYYIFEDNNRLHGENFTEWVNVRQVTHNQFGQETIRPHDSIGYYNGLEFATRKRHGAFLRNNGFYGAVFHHYWFDGRPVMEHIIEAMLKDGEPDIPFMLSWANEPWSKRWDGSDGKDVLIAQKYRLQEAWRKHFDWLLPFFKHPKYIRSEGKVQFVVYHPSHVGNIGAPMYAAWRQWAIEEGLGGIDIIETRWGQDPHGLPQWDGHPPDAINEFQPHVAGLDHAKFSATKRISRVYHRGTMACWDTSPRHKTDGRATAQPMCHPKTWKWHLVEMFRTIKADPNPIHADNFFFVNALNEWGEGNSLEPSVQFGFGYGNAMKEAIAISEKEHVWPDKTTEISLDRDIQMLRVMNQTADVCVLVQASFKNAEDQPFKLSAMLRSLQAQKIQNWRAAVVPKQDGRLWDLDSIFIQALDPRITRIDAPKKTDVNATTNGPNEYEAIYRVISNLTELVPSCAGARYLLVADGGDLYEPTAFDAVSGDQVGTKADLIRLAVESKYTVFNHPQLRNSSWDSRCSLLENETLDLSAVSHPTAPLSLSATFISLPRLLSTGLDISSFPTTSFQSFTQANSTAKVYHDHPYSLCVKSGNFWFDSPNYEETGCWTASDFVEKMEKKDKGDIWKLKSEGKRLGEVDFGYQRQRGVCVRYKEEAYLKARAEVEKQKLELKDG